MTEQDRPRDPLGREGAMELWMSALSGVAELALALEKLGISDEEDSLEDAHRLRPTLLAAVEREAREAEQHRSQERRNRRASVVIAACLPSIEELADRIEALGIEGIEEADALEIGAVARRIALEIIEETLR